MNAAVAEGAGVFEPLRAITEEEKAAFARDGVVMLPGVLAAEPLLALAGCCERILALPQTRNITAEAIWLAAASQPDTLFETSARAIAGRGRYFVSLNTARQEPAVLAFALRGAVGGIAAAVLRSTRARFLDDVLVVQEPCCQECTEWHDDDCYSLATGEQRCSVWVSLGDVGEDGGALRFVRRSHRYLLDRRKSGLDPERIAAAHASDVVLCPVRLGDVLVFHPTTLHGAGPNRSAKLRRAFSFRFAGDDARFKLRAARLESRELYRLADGELLGGPLLPLAWPPEPTPLLAAVAANAATR